MRRPVIRLAAYGLVAALMMGAGAAVGAAGSPEDDAELRAARAFAEKVGAYVSLQKAVVQKTSAKPSPASASVIALRREGLASELAAARRNVGQGEIFSPEVGDHFRRLIHHAFSGKQRRAMRRTIREDDHVRPVVLHVNAIYPESIPMTTMPPTVLRVLPVLPPELAYRIVGAALVLMDIRTNLIVDFLPDAIPGVR